MVYVRVPLLNFIKVCNIQLLVSRICVVRCLTDAAGSNIIQRQTIIQQLPCLQPQILRRCPRLGRLHC